MISLIIQDQFRIFRGPLFHKQVTGQELSFAVSYSKPALVCDPWLHPWKKWLDFVIWSGLTLPHTIKVQMSIFCNSKRSEVNKQGCQNTISNHFTFLIIHFRLILKETNKKTRCKCDGLVLWWMSSVIEYLINVLAI